MSKKEPAEEMASNRTPIDEVRKILTYCTRIKLEAADLEAKVKKIDDKGKTKRWDPCNTLINDAIHGPVELNSLLTEIINTPEFQRLRYIKQLGGGCYVYPGANHTRFDHSIGVCYIAGEFAHFLKHQLEEEHNYSGSESTGDGQMECSISKEEVLCLQIAGLCHDLGHGPFSHTFEHRVLDRMDDVNLTHEQLSLKVFEHIMTNSTVLIQFAYIYKLGFNDFILIKDMIHPKRDRIPKYDPPCLSESKTRSGTPKHFLLEIVANKESGIDVDKWDYFTRDCHYLGIAMDFQWKRCMLLSRICNFEGEYRICFRDKELDNLYGMGRTRSTLHRKASVHKTKVAVEEMFARAIDKVKTVPLITISDKDKQHQSSTEDTKSIKEAIELVQTEDELQWFIALSDVSVTTLIMNWKTSTNKDHNALVFEAQDLLKRIERRHLYHQMISKRLPKCNQKDKPSATENGNRDDVASWNITNMMTAIKNDTQLHLQKEKERKKRLLHLSTEVFGEGTEEEKNTFIEIACISFGSEKKTDPMEGVLFYTKDQPKSAFKMDTQATKESSSLVVPEHFTEYEIRLYYTGLEQDDELNEKLRKKFHKWLDEKIYEIPLNDHVVT